MFNSAIMSNPANWFKVGLMALTFFVALNLFFTTLGGSK